MPDRLSFSAVVLEVGLGDDRAGIGGIGRRAAVVADVVRVRVVVGAARGR